MAILTKAALLGASDLVEREVELPSIGGEVRIRSLPAAYSNQAQSEAIEMVQGRRGEQTTHVNSAKLEALKVLHALIDPKFDSIEEVTAWAETVGPAWHKLVTSIDEISGIEAEDVEKANATFPAGGQGERGSDVANGTSPGAGRPDLPVRAGA